MNDFEYLKMSFEPVFRRYGVRKAVLFGSVARGQAGEKSDIDLYVDSGLRGLKFVGLVEALRNASRNREVDVLDMSHVEQGSRIEEEVKRTGVLLYEG